MCWHEIRNILINARVSQKMSLTTLARITQTSPGYIHDIEIGRATPSLDMLNRIANALNVKIYAESASEE